MNYATTNRGDPAEAAELEQAVKARCDLIGAEFRAAKAAGNVSLCDSLRGELELLRRKPTNAVYRRVRRGLVVHLSHPQHKRSAADDAAEVANFLTLVGGESVAKTPRRNATAAGDARLVADALRLMSGADRPG